MRLSRATVPATARIGAAAPEGTGIVHLGLGQFHRAHQAVNTALALAAEPGEWGIVGVAHHSPAVARAMAEQDHLYSVLQLDPADERADVVDVHRETLVAATQPQAVIDRIADPRHRIVTLTITEKGYLRTPGATGTGTADRRAIADDLARGLPGTMIGLLARGLERRARDRAPIAVVSCDNVSSNGLTTRSAVLDYLDMAGAESSVMDHIAHRVSFANTMVDRIVPATTDLTRARVAQLLGVDDRVPVPAERFSMWVLEDAFPAGRPAWEAAGAVFSDEVGRYEDLKLLLLNAMHSLISYAGALAGCATIPEAWTTGFVREAVTTAIGRECLPVITTPSGFDLETHVARLHDRWSNTALGDSIARVGSDGSSKLPQRVPRPALGALDRGEVPHLMALTTAAWICCVCPPDGFRPGPIADQMDEPRRADLAALAKGRRGSDRVRSLVAAVMPELADQDRFIDRVTDLVETITAAGIEQAATEAIAGWERA
jgi:fructuronate reductase